MKNFSILTIFIRFLLLNVSPHPTTPFPSSSFSFLHSILGVFMAAHKIIKIDISSFLIIFFFLLFFFFRFLLAILKRLSCQPRRGSFLISHVHKRSPGSLHQRWEWKIDFYYKLHKSQVFDASVLTYRRIQSAGTAVEFPPSRQCSLQPCRSELAKEAKSQWFPWVFQSISFGIFHATQQLHSRLSEGNYGRY